MFSVVIMGHKAYALAIDDDFRDADEDTLENIQAHVSQGNTVIICEELEELKDLAGVDFEQVQIIKPD